MRANSQYYASRKLFHWDSLCDCCGANYFTNSGGIDNKGTQNGIAIYEGIDLPVGEEENGQYVTSKIETKNGTFFVKVRTRWEK